MIVIRWVLSLVFVIQMYLAMAVFAILGAPWALLTKNGAHQVCKAYCNWVILTARLLCGLRSETRGDIPAGDVLVAAKHQSFFDIIMIFAALPRARFIMKRELIYAPFLGQYALRMGCIPVARGKKGAAIAKLKADVEKGLEDPGQLVIYPQGTRVNPGVEKPYKPGIGIIYTQFGQPCVPVAANVGVFWPKRGILRKPGLAVVEFLPAIEPGLALPDFMERLESEVETHSNRLMREAGFTALPKR